MDVIELWWPIISSPVLLLGNICWNMIRISLGLYAAIVLDREAKSLKETLVVEKCVDFITKTGSN